jgi:hypothetical protein
MRGANASNSTGSDELDKVPAVADGALPVLRETQLGEGHMSTRTTLLLSCVGMFVSVAASAAEPAAAQPAAATAVAAAPAAAEAEARPIAPGTTVNWDKMTVVQRKKYMKMKVVPEMKKLFQAFDGKRYASFGCQTCHGENPSDKKFKMPNAELPKLPQPTDRAGFMALQEKKPEAAKFMGTQVKPTMAKLLGLAEWSPTTPKGFGCYGCHTQQAEMTAPAAPGSALPPSPTPAPAAAPAPAGKPAAKAATAAPAHPAAPAGGGW